jgi:NAD(P)-dependent dehydrogenase (short-subunit alcohol dehydrogenase family)
MGVPGDVAPAVVYLASREAHFITGQTLSVNGGNTVLKDDLSETGRLVGAGKL